jgi:hypothetical protein
MILIPEFYKHIPETKDMKVGILYVSMEYGVCIHFCACNCGQQSVTPFYTPDLYRDLHHRWEFKNEDGLISLSPSILNYGCNAHYYLVRNEIKWC